MNWKNKLLANLIVAMVLASCTPLEEETTYANPDALIEPLQLVTMMERGEAFKLIDVRPMEKFEQGHLPGAIQVWRPDIQDTAYAWKGMMAGKSQIESLFSTLGIRSNDFIVIYDAKGNPDAARLWWILQVYGHFKVALLNGGLHSWENEGLPIVEGQTPALPSSEFQFVAVGRAPMHIEMQQVKQLLAREKGVLMDTRCREEYYGEWRKGSAHYAGHIPTSIWLDFAELFHYGDNKDCRFKSRQELDAIMDSVGVAPNDFIVTYCQSGVRSALTTFVLSELLGYHKVTNFDGSWLQWTYEVDSLENHRMQQFMEAR